MMSASQANACIVLSFCVIGYAIVILTGPQLSTLIWLAALIGLLAFCGWHEANEGFYISIHNFIVEPRALRFNLFWLIVLIFACGGAYVSIYMQTLHLRYYSATGYRTGAMGEMVRYLYRFGFFAWWLMTESAWRWVLYLACVGLAILAFLRRFAIAGWLLLALQMAVGTLIRFNKSMMTDFVVYYESLMSVQPVAHP